MIKTIDQLKNIRRWAAITKDMLKTRGFAARVSKVSKMSLSESMLLRILTEDLEQQREPNSDILPFIIQVAEDWTYNRNTDYSKQKQ